MCFMHAYKYYFYNINMSIFSAFISGISFSRTVIHRKESEAVKPWFLPDAFTALNSCSYCMCVARHQVPSSGIITYIWVLIFKKRNNLLLELTFSLWKILIFIYLRNYVFRKFHIIIPNLTNNNEKRNGVKNYSNWAKERKRKQ